MVGDRDSVIIQHL